MEYYHLSPVSSNAKTGPMAVTTSSSNTCPDCPFREKSKGGNGLCYASANINLKRHWSKVSDGSRGVEWFDFLLKIDALTRGSKLRLNQAGDFASDAKNGNNFIDGKKLRELTAVIKKRKLQAIAYTHKEPKGQNLRHIRAAIKNGLNINVSANNLEQADEYHKLGLPTVVVVSENFPEKSVTPGGRKTLVCLGQSGRAKNCAECGVCSKKDRNGLIIAFRAHGNQKKKISEILT